MPFVILFIADLPISLVAFGVMFTSSEKGMIAAALWGVLGTLWWFLIGFAIDARIRSYRKNRVAQKEQAPATTTANSESNDSRRRELLIAVSTVAVVIVASLAWQWNGRQGHFEKGKIGNFAFAPNGRSIVLVRSCLSPDCSMILVRQQVKGSKIVEYLKTEAGYRIVDLCPELAEYLRKFVGDRKGLLFPSRKRTTPISYRSFLKRILTPSMKKLGIKEPGKAAHAFRRFRSSILAKSGVEEDIRKFWLGHENNDITAQYAEQIREDNVWRQTLAANVGLGFQIPAFVPKPIVRNVRKNRQAVEVAMVG